MALTIAVLSQKGGTGKTTTVRTLADVFRRAGLAGALRRPRPAGEPLRLLRRARRTPTRRSPTCSADGARRPRRSTTASSPPTSGWPRRSSILSGKMGRELTLKRALKEVKRSHDIVLIDCPPALGLLTVNGLVAADHALISTEAQYFSLQGVEQALEVIELAKENLHPELEWLGVVLNIADLRTLHSREALAPAARALRRQGLRHGHPPVDPLRGVGRARRLDPRLRAAARRRLPGARPGGARAGGLRRGGAPGGSDA